MSLSYLTRKTYSMENFQVGSSSRKQIILVEYQRVSYYKKDTANNVIGITQIKQKQDPQQVDDEIFKGYFMAHLVKGIKQGKITIPAGYYESTGGDYYGWKDKLYRKDWVVYTKKPFSGVKCVIDYLGRYSHRVAITNRRIVDIDASKGVVSFEYKVTR